MLRLPQMLMIGSTGRNSGKTLLACALIERFRSRQEIVGIKVTAVDRTDGTCPRGGQGCGVCSSLTDDYCITEETDTGSGKDTARLLAAGARRVFWLRVRKTRLEAGIRALLDLAGDAPLICESNSLRQAVIPGLFLITREQGSAAWKESARAVRRHADRVVNGDGQTCDVNLDDVNILDGRWILREDAAAIVMAGGDSRRMKQDKAMLTVDGVPMIQHVCRQLTGHFDPVLVSARDSGQYAFLALDVIPDRTPGQGPLMGIASTLSTSPRELNLVVSCDMPSLELPTARRMLRLAENADAVVPRCGDLLEPLFAVYRRSLAPTLFNLLASGERRVRTVFQHCRTAYADLPDDTCLRNLNTMDEYDNYIRSASAS